LEWVLDEAEAAGLVVNSQKAGRVLGLSDSSFAHPDPKGILHRSLSGFWWVLEFWPKPHKDMRFIPPKAKWGIGLGRRRFIRDGATVHQSVVLRMEQLPDYRPKNLPEKYEIEPWKHRAERPVGG
jgi:hypothetical protein